MVNRLRDYGDGQMIALYTNENNIYKRLKDSTKVIRSQAYEQEQKGRFVVVGYDLYFAKKHRAWLKDRIQPQTP